MLPEVEEYVRTRDTVFDEADHLENVTWGEYDDGLIGFEERNQRFRDASDARDTKLTTALTEFTAKATDPLVKWIIKEFDQSLKDGDSLAVMFLRDLPEDYDWNKIQEIFNDHGWCSAADDYLERAIKDGVQIKNVPDPLSPAQQQLVDFVSGTFNRRNQRTFLKLLEAVVAEAREDVVVTVVKDHLG